MLMNGTMLAISGRDTLRPLGIYFRQTIYVKLNTINGVLRKLVYNDPISIF